jgi:DNA invertase Pin-like site-specific DNA recombinase
VAIWVTKVKRIVTIQMSAPKDSATSADDPLRTFLEGLDRAELVDLLIESAHTEGIVQRRLERRRLATDPAQLAADFKRTLQGWKRSQRFIAYQEAHAFAASLQEWLDQIERELLPIQPALARELYEAFIVSDRRFFEGADDSDGIIGDAIRSACSLWLKAAKSSATETDWIERLYDLASDDEYGAREPLLEQANILLDEPALRALAGRFEHELDFAIKNGQTVANQERELREAAEAKGWEIVEVYRDNGVSGAKGRRERKGLDRALKEAVQGRYDVLAAWSVDRLGRSLQDLLHTLQELHGVGCDLYLHRQALDTRTPSGRAMFQMLDVFAEFVRSMIVDLVKAGLEHARHHGTKTGKPIGRPPVGSKVEREVRALRGKGFGMLRIARELGIGTGTVQRILAGA